MEQPLPNCSCYRVSSAPALLGGSYPGSVYRDESLARLRSFRDAAVSCFVDLTEPDELPEYASLFPRVWTGESGPVYHRLPIMDVSVPHQPSHLMTILDTVDAALAEGRRVYVHCWGGAGRTGLVIGAWLVRHGMAGDAALAEVQRLYDGTRRPGDRRRRSPETWEQQEYVRRWAEYEAAWGARDGTSQAAGVRTRLQRWRERVSGR